MSEMLYLQTERNIKITSPVVTLGDVAQLSCSDGAVLARNQVRRVAHLPDDGYGRYVCSASTLVRLVTEAEEHVDVTHIGEPNFILTYEDPRQKNTWISWCKTILVGILTFIGTAFSIMTFHTDIGVRELFLDVYTRFLPQMTPGFSVLEISYSIGIGLGVVLYFNHFGRRKFTQRWILQNGYGSRRQKLIQKMEQQHGTQPAMHGWICLRQLDPCAERIRKELSFCLRKHIRQTRCSH